RHGSADREVKSMSGSTRVLAISSILASACAVTQPAPVSQIELNGTNIGESRGSIEQRLGPPRSSWTNPDGQEHWLYIIDDASRTQLIVSFESFRRDFAFAVQLTGGRSENAKSFLGVSLGDPRSALSAWGPPTQETPVDDPAVKDLGLHRLSYAGRNY